MAFYNTNSYYHSYDSYDSYDSYCDSAQIDPPIPQSSDEPTIYNLFDYPIHHFGQPNFKESAQLIEYEPVDQVAYSYPISYTANSCCASSYSVPTVIEYHPDSYAESHHKVTATQFAISYSVVSEFNEVEFEEYDPTPYGGGYDISETYGKPLQPSIQICYPKSGTVMGIPKPPIEEQAKQWTKTEEIREEPSSTKTKPTQIEKDGDKQTVNSLPDSGSGYGNYGRELSEFPSGYGLEAVDLCESLFGHWPCLSRIKRQTACGRCCVGHCHCYGNYGSQWQGAADYLFGSHNPYPDGRIHGEAVYANVWLNENV